MAAAAAGLSREAPVSGSVGRVQTFRLEHREHPPAEGGRSRVVAPGGGQDVKERLLESELRMTPLADREMGGQAKGLFRRQLAIEVFPELAHRFGALHLFHHSASFPSDFV